MRQIITIGREFGSGGRQVGERLAERLGEKCYDEELLAEASEQSGLTPEMMEANDEKPANSFLYSLSMHGGSMGVKGYTGGYYVEMPMNHKVFLALFQTIQRLANEGPCVIVGRCGDYALQNRDDVINVFIHSDLEDKVKRVCEVYGIPRDQALTKITKIDKMRASHYNYYSDRKWGVASTYDLTLNSAVLGVDGCVEMIIQFAEMKERMGQKSAVHA